jgi:hypothetical protein
VRTRKRLAPSQREALKKVLANRIVVITAEARAYCASQGQSASEDARNGSNLKLGESIWDFARLFYGLQSESKFSQRFS